MEITSPNKTSISLRRADRRVWRLYFIVSCFGLLVIPPIFAFYGNSIIKGGLAVALLSVCLYPTARYFARRESGVPLFSVLCLSYGIQFGLPIFLKEPEISTINGSTYLEDPSVIAALLLSIAGVCALQLGYYTFKTHRFAKVIPAINLHLNEKKALVYCLLIGILSPLIFGALNSDSDLNNPQFSAIFTLLHNQRLVVIGILGWLVYSGRGSKWHKFLLYCVVGFATLQGLSSAFLEQAIVPLAILFVTKWRYTKKLPVAPLLATTAIILFLSPVKGTFRDVVWSDSASATEVSDNGLERASLWVEQAAQYWASVFSGERGVTDATSKAASRTDLIHQFAHIYSQTPDVVPFQHGSTYSYFAVAFIPRALWPDKPTAGGANIFFAVAYGITTEEGSTRATFGVSLLGEGYINFGIPGVLFIMTLQGIVLMLLQHIFGSERSGAGGQAVFLAFFIFFLNGVGTSAEIFFGNIVQNLLASCVLLWWAREKPSIRRRLSQIELTREIAPGQFAR
jgi:hypothetical protein